MFKKKKRNEKETCGFLGLCQFYRKFIQNFQKIAESLHTFLTRWKILSPSLDSTKKIRKKKKKNKMLQKISILAPF